MLNVGVARAPEGKRDEPREERHEQEHDARRPRRPRMVDGGAQLLLVREAKLLKLRRCFPRLVAESIGHGSGRRDGGNRKVDHAQDQIEAYR